MKKMSIIVAILVLGSLINYTAAQTINWRSFKKEERIIANINAGWDYGLTMGAGVGYKFKTRLPLIINGEYSFPSGKQLFDDFKTKLAVQSELLKLDRFSFSAKLSGVFRQTTSPLVQLNSYGGEFVITTGYYMPRWYVAAEAGFDKAITTRFKHSDEMKEDYPGVRDGWYIPTGGNFQYGVQGGWTIGKNDIGLRVGKVITQDFKTTPMIPYYFQVLFNRRW